MERSASLVPVRIRFPGEFARQETWGRLLELSASAAVLSTQTPLKAPEQDPHAEVASGAIAYWPPGHAFCIFFGQEPYSPVNVLGALDGDAKLFARVKSVVMIWLSLPPLRDDASKRTEQ